MPAAIRRMLWTAVGALTLLVVAGVGMTLLVLQRQSREEYLMVQVSRPLLDSVRNMDEKVLVMVSAARGYVLTHQSQFLQQYDDAVGAFDMHAALAVRLSSTPRDRQLLSDFRRHFVDIRGLCEQQIAMAREGRDEMALESVLETARLRRLVPDYADLIAADHRATQTRELEHLASLRQWLIVAIVLGAVLIVMGAIAAVSRIEQSLLATLKREVRRTEAIVAGMSDGVMLVNADGHTVFVNPAGARLLGTSEVGIPIFRHAEVYGLRNSRGETLHDRELPAARALSTGQTVNDASLRIRRGDRDVAVSMTAAPLMEEGRVSSVIVTFRDVTERRLLEEQMVVQAERAQILADAGTFFASNIDPNWVSQAIAERVADVLGDWAAVILAMPDSDELRVAAIHHRDMASIGLAWSYIYRQPLTIGQGVIGQVVASGFPSLISNVGSRRELDDSSYHAAPAKIASLLVLPLRTRRENLGALVIAATDGERVMTDDKLPLAELLAERAALAIDNSRLYTEQVEARRKVEDLSRLKDEFLSIASHELRTPVTSIKGYTQLAKTLIREQDVTTAQEYLDIALDQIDRMSRLILELLDVSRIETGRLEIRRDPIPWNTFVREVVQRHHTAFGDRRLHVDLPEESETVLGDRDRLEQVLGNLLENAVKYSPDGSEIFVTVSRRDDEVITAVRDRGIGIPPDEVPQVFERFHRGRQVSSTNYGGLGLGLYITRQIVERHKGTIWIESAQGVGTTFFFALPLERVESPTETNAVART